MQPGIAQLADHVTRLDVRANVDEPLLEVDVARLVAMAADLPMADDDDIRAGFVLMRDPDLARRSRKDIRAATAFADVEGAVEVRVGLGRDRLVENGELSP